MAVVFIVAMVLNIILPDDLNEASEAREKLKLENLPK